MDYIIPTKKNPIYQIVNSYSGNFDLGIYKNALVGNSTTQVSALNYIDAVNKLHEWLKENNWIANENCYKGSTFEIYQIDGKLSKYGDVVSKKVYNISFAKCKSLIWR